MALSAFGSTLKEAGNMMLQPPQEMDPNYTTVLEKLPLEDITNNYNFDVSEAHFFLVLIQLLNHI